MPVQSGVLHYEVTATAIVSSLQVDVHDNDSWYKYITEWHKLHNEVTVMVVVFALQFNATYDEVKVTTIEVELYTDVTCYDITPVSTIRRSTLM